jgi:hypothetical protein
MSAPLPAIVVAQVVARNIVPLAGVLFLGWDARNVLVLYFADTILTIGVICAGVLRKFAPPVEDDGWAARANGEAGVVAGGAFIAAVIAVPFGVFLVFMLGGTFDWRAAIDDASLRAGLAWQCIAAFWSYLGLYRALRHATPEQLQLKRRFGLVFLRWFALVMVAAFGTGFVLGRHGAIVFVAIYVAVSIVAEIAPDRLLRMVPDVPDGNPVVAPPHARMPKARDRRRKRR